MPVIKSHPSVPACPHDDQVIWRFISLEKFIYMLLRSSIYFCQVKSLRESDPFEGNFTKAQIEFYSTVLANPEIARVVVPMYFRSADGQDGKIDDGTLEVMSRLFLPENMKMIADIGAQISYVNCWHINEHESAGLWRLYCSENSGIAIKSTVGRLIRSLENNKEDIYVGNVRYIDYNKDHIPIGNSFHVVFAKSVSFAHERELRICVSRSHKDGENVKGIDVSCDMTSLIDKVLVAPASQGWFFEVVSGIAKCLCPSLDVLRSDLFSALDYY